MRLAAHGLALELPPGWDGRIYRHASGPPILHAASFALPTDDGDFGSGATGAMPAGGAFFALKEYEPGTGLIPGRGLYAAHKLPVPLDPMRFNARVLQVGRRGQAGMQHFFTAARRPFCLYAVVSTAPSSSAQAASAHERVAEVSRILSSLTIGARS
jgi:hypothetical protein